MDASLSSGPGWSRSHSAAPDPRRPCDEWLWLTNDCGDHGDAGDRDGAAEAMPGLPIADLLEAEGGRRELEGRLAIEALLHSLAEELVLPEIVQCVLVDLQGVEVDGDGEGSRGVFERAAVLASHGGKELTRIAAGCLLEAVVGDLMPRESLKSQVGLSGCEDEHANVAGAGDDVVTFGRFDAEGGADELLVGSMDADPDGAGVGSHCDPPGGGSGWSSPERSCAALKRPADVRGPHALSLLPSSVG